LSSAAQNGLTKSQCHSVFMRIEIPVTESSFRSKLQNRFTPQRNTYSHANGIPIHIRPESLFTSQRNVYSHRPEYPGGGGTAGGGGVGAASVRRRARRLRAVARPPRAA